jgi:GNAT superfamily N-acetyltransferase
MLSSIHDLNGAARHEARNSTSYPLMKKENALNTDARNAVRIVRLESTHIHACEAIARSLPAWFGIEEGLQDMRHCLETEPGLVALDGETITGFITIAAPFPETREITWMAVAPTHHRRGTGRALIDALAHHAISEGATMLHVKTLADLHPSHEYAPTRAFYMSQGFHRLVVLPDLWGPKNPCLLLVRPL